jgi:hypothetical protein
MMAMNVLKGSLVSGISFLLLLFFISLTGCAAYPEAVALDAHPEKYREVYLMKPKNDPREIAPRVSARLKEAGFQVTEIDYDNTGHAGTTGIKKRDTEPQTVRSSQNPAAICWFDYVSLQDLTFWRWWSFEHLEIEFRDAESDKVVFRTTKNNYDTPTPENTELDRRFVEIANGFFPGQPNPFKQKK